MWGGDGVADVERNARGPVVNSFPKDVEPATGTPRFAVVRHAHPLRLQAGSPASMRPRGVDADMMISAEQ